MKTKNFWNELKGYLLQVREANENVDIIGYYETLKQNEGVLGEVIRNCENNWYNLTYTPDQCGGYTDGSLTIEFNDLDYIYVIDLQNTYYSSLEQDWFKPTIKVTKMSTLCCSAFDGEISDLKVLREAWNDDLKEYKKRKTMQKLEKLNAEKSQLEMQMQELLKEIETA